MELPNEIWVAGTTRHRIYAEPPAIPISECKLMMVGECAGEVENIKRMPFRGGSGHELDKMLDEVGLSRNEIYLTNVIPFWPPGNNFRNFCIKYNKGNPKPKDYPLGPVESGWYLRPDLLIEVGRLGQEIAKVKPNLVIALGNKALWALCGVYKITKFRGTIMESTLVPGQKILPTFHPAYVLRNWSARTIVLGDLQKAIREMESSKIVRPQRFITIEPTVEDVARFIRDYIKWRTSFDVETSPKRRIMTCCGFGPSKDRSICIPWVDRRKPGYSYWSTLDEEIEVHKLVGSVLANPAIEKIMQHGVYDVIWSRRKMGWDVNNWQEDPMLVHHALYPEMQKGLAFMGAGYTDEVAWKMLRPKGGTERREE